MNFVTGLDVPEADLMAAAESPGVDTGTAVMLALASTVVLIALHLLARRIRSLPLVPEQVTASFAGGLAVAYVFLHLLPEIARGNEELRELFGETGGPSALLELGIFIVALTGFLVFYALERLAERSREHATVAAGRPVEHARGGPWGRSDGESGDGSPHSASVPEPGTGNKGVFWVHLASFAVYNALIAYTLPLNYRTNVPFAVLFTVAMGLHFVLSDRGLEEHYGKSFDRWPPRLLLAAALVVGWVLASLFAPTRSVTVSLLTAFLAGSILLNVFKEEIPSTRRSSLRWFTIGLVTYSLLLLGVTLLEGEGEEAAGDAAAAAVPSASGAS